jgi:sec-independent protein translocase protein TatB
MLDIGWSEFFVIGVIALVVIGPRELPAALRSLGQIIARARGLAREFRDGLDDIARETEVKNIADNMIGDFDKEANEEWMATVNAGKLEKQQTPVDGEDDTAAAADDASEEFSASDLVDDEDEAAIDEAEAAETVDEPAPKPKDAPKDAPKDVQS